MQKKSRYSLEIYLLPKVILLFGVVSFLLIFANAITTRIDFYIPGNTPPSFSVMEYFKGYNIAFSIPTQEVELEYFSIFAGLSYFLPLLLGILINLIPDRLDWIYKRYIYLAFAVLFIIIPILYVLNVSEIAADLVRTFEADASGISLFIIGNDVQVGGSVIAHAALSIIAGIFTFAYLFLFSKKRRQ